MTHSDRGRQLTIYLCAVFAWTWGIAALLVVFPDQIESIVSGVEPRTIEDIRFAQSQIRTFAETQADIGTGKGARHSSAAKMSAEAGCLAITVSQDGPITAYEGGRRVFSL